jgi:hypothetical protein
MTDADIRRYADATGDRNALWFDDACAAGYEKRMLPPTLSVAPSASKKIRWHQHETRTCAGRFRAANHTNVRNAGSETEWLLPAYPGEPPPVSVIVYIVWRRAFRRGDLHQPRRTGFKSRPRKRRRHTIALFLKKSWQRKTRARRALSKSLISPARATRF